MQTLPTFYDREVIQNKMRNSNYEAKFTQEVYREKSSRHPCLIRIIAPLPI